MPLQVSRLAPGGDGLIPMVTFTLKGEKVQTKWEKESDAFKNFINQGIVTAKGVFFPKDGKPYYDNLEKAYSRSTMIQVQEVPE
jgi:hypothetical protein